MTYIISKSHLDRITPLNLLHYVESKGFTIIKEGNWCYHCFNENQKLKHISIDKAEDLEHIYLSILYILEEINTKPSIIISWIYKNDVLSTKEVEP